MAAVVIDILVAVDVPLARSLGVVDVDTVRPCPAGIVNDTARQKSARLMVALRGARGARDVTRNDPRFTGGSNVRHGWPFIRMQGWRKLALAEIILMQ